MSAWWSVLGSTQSMRLTELDQLTVKGLAKLNYVHRTTNVLTKVSRSKFLQPMCYYKTR